MVLELKIDQALSVVLWCYMTLMKRIVRELKVKTIIIYVNLLLFNFKKSNQNY